MAYPIGRSYRLGVSLAGLWLLGALTVSAWWFDQAASRATLTWRLFVLLFTLILAGMALFSFWRTQVRRRLVFDGGQWYLTGADARHKPTEPAHVAILWDAQRCMLLRWPSVDRECLQARWLWADASSDPLRWHLLRCALYSPANRPAAEVVDDSGRN